MTPTTVRTPADLTVIATCPTCEQPTAIRMQIGAELLVSDEGSELRLKGRSKGVAHICDQLPLALDGATLDTILDKVADEVNAGALNGNGMTATMTRIGDRTVDTETGEIIVSAETQAVFRAAVDGVPCLRDGGDCVTHDAAWPEVAKACWAVNPPPRKRAAS